MKDGLKEIVGKRIAGVVVAESDQDSRQQVFLVFGDGTTFEFHGNHFTCSAGLKESARLANYLKSGGAQVKRIFPAALATTSANEAHEEPAAPESLEGLLQRDLEAWKAARATVDRARRRPVA